MSEIIERRKRELEKFEKKVRSVVEAESEAKIAKAEAEIAKAKAEAKAEAEARAKAEAEVETLRQQIAQLQTQHAQQNK